MCFLVAPPSEVIQAFEVGMTGMFFFRRNPYYTCSNEFVVIKQYSPNRKINGLFLSLIRFRVFLDTL